MNEIVNTQTLLFIRAIQVGMLLASLYDLIRIARKMVKHPNWLVQIEDMLYWIVCMFISFGIFYIHNFASIRFFVLIGMLLGAVFYLVTFSIVFMKVATYVIEVVKKALSCLIQWLSIPIKWLIRLICIPITLLISKWHHLTTISHRKRKHMQRKLRYIQDDAKAGIHTKRNKKIYTKEKID